MLQRQHVFQDFVQEGGFSSSFWIPQDFEFFAESSVVLDELVPKRPQANEEDAEYRRPEPSSSWFRGFRWRLEVGCVRSGIVEAIISPREANCAMHKRAAIPQHLWPQQSLHCVVSIEGWEGGVVCFLELSFTAGG